MLEAKGGLVTHALGLNAQRELAAIRRLIERKIPVDLSVLADPTYSFNTMLKQKA